MSANVTVPSDLWEGDFEAVITNWLASDGARVEANEPLVEIMVEKAQYEIVAPASGKLAIKASIDEIVSKNSVIATIG